MFENIINIIISTVFLVFLDKIISYKFNKPYYLLHGLVNFIIVYLVYNDIIILYTDFDNSYNYLINTKAIDICIALHFYHIIAYNLTYEDWKHHILMFLVEFNVVYILNYKYLVVSHVIFYLCGLPGGIDYILLFLVRNNYINKYTEKYYNHILNIFIRSSGAIISSFIINIYRQNHFKNINDYRMNDIYYLYTVNTLYTLVMIYTYYNGIYYMYNVFENYIMTKQIIKIKLNN